MSRAYNSSSPPFSLWFVFVSAGRHFHLSVFVGLFFCYLFSRVMCYKSFRKFLSQYSLYCVWVCTPSFHWNWHPYDRCHQHNCFENFSLLIKIFPTFNVKHFIIITLQITYLNMYATTIVCVCAISQIAHHQPTGVIPLPVE